MDTSEKIVSLRSAFGLSQEELAARIGVARQTVVSWEQGARPSAFNRRRICEEFSLPVNYFDADVALSLTSPQLQPGEVLKEDPVGQVLAEETVQEPALLSKNAQRASDAFRSLGTVIRWGNVFFAGVIALVALICIAIVLIMVSIAIAAQAEGGVSIVIVNGRAVFAIFAILIGFVIAFYAACFFVRLLLREILRDHVRRKRDDEMPFQQNKQK